MFAVARDEGSWRNSQFTVLPLVENTNVLVVHSGNQGFKKLDEYRSEFRADREASARNEHLAERRDIEASCDGGVRAEVHTTIERGADVALGGFADLERAAMHRSTGVWLRTWTTARTDDALVERQQLVVRAHAIVIIDQLTGEVVAFFDPSPAPARWRRELAERDPEMAVAVSGDCRVGQGGVP